MTNERSVGEDFRIAHDGAARIAIEREKQRAKWGDAHDDEHDGGMLAGVAAILAARLAEECDSVPVAVYVDGIETREDPWGLAEKHDADPIRRLQIAGALIAAEIDRRLRLCHVCGDPGDWSCESSGKRMCAACVLRSWRYLPTEDGR